MKKLKQDLEFINKSIFNHKIKFNAIMTQLNEEKEWLENEIKKKQLTPPKGVIKKALKRVGMMPKLKSKTRREANERNGSKISGDARKGKKGNDLSSRDSTNADNSNARRVSERESTEGCIGDFILG